MTEQAPQYILARVKAGARKERIQKIREGVYEIQVREKAERGEANLRVKVLLAEACNIRSTKLRLIKGATSPSKTFLLINHKTP